MNPDERDDDLMREYLDGDSALSRLYRRGADERPAAELDARILAESRRAVARGRVAHSPFARHWFVPASLAAVFLLSVSVVVLMPDSEAPVVEIEQSADTALPEARMRDAPAGAADAAEQEALPARLEAPGEADTGRRQASDVEEPAAGGSAFSAAPRPPAAGKQPADDAGGGSDMKRKAQASERTRSAESQSAPAPSGSAGVASEAVAPAAPPPAPWPLPAQAVQDDPHAWLRFIEALLDARDRAGALSNLRAFRHRYADVPLPERLANLAASPHGQPP